MKIQTAVRLLSEDRLRVGHFPVGILFWDDLMESLTSSIPDFKKHYPQIHLESEPVEAPELLCALDAAYIGSSIKRWMELIFGEFGLMANENPFQFESGVRGLEASTRPLMTEGAHAELAGCCRSVVQACAAAQWGEAENVVVRIKGFVDSLEYGFTGRMLAAYTLGKLFGVWGEHADNGDGPITVLDDELPDTCKRLFGDDTTANEMLAMLQEFNASKSVGAVKIPHRAYNLVRRRLLREGMR